MNVEHGLISKLIVTGDMKTITEEQVNVNLFSGTYRNVFKFISDYYLQYGVVPDKTVVSRYFPDFRVIKTGKRKPLRWFINEVRRKAMHNRIADAIEKCYSYLDNRQSELALKEFERVVSEINKSVIKSQDIELTASVDELKDEFERLEKLGGIIGIPTLIKELDNCLKGLQKEQLITIIARLGVGKTWFLVLLLVNIYKQGYDVAFGTTEMSVEMIRRRVVSMLYNIPYVQLRSGKMILKDKRRYFKCLEKLRRRKNKFYIFRVNGGVSFIRAKVEQYKPDILGIDGMYLMEDDQGATEEVWKVSHITRDLHSLAGDLKIPIVGTTQANRATSKKTGPEIDNISYSDSVGQDCLPGDTLILTKEGYKRISLLKDHVFYVYDGNKYKKATAVYAGLKEKVEIQYRGRKFVCSPNHRLYVYDNEVGEFVWKRAKDVQPNIDYLLQYSEPYGDGHEHIVRVISNRGYKGIKVPINATEELGRFIGYMIGDGSIRPYDKGQVSLACGYDFEYANEAIRIVKKYFGIEGKIRYQQTKYSKKEQISVYWYGKKFSDWVKFMVEPHGNKTTRLDFAEMNVEFRMGVIAGLIQSDGSIQGQVEVVSSEESVVDGFCSLLDTLGISTKKTFAKNEGKGKYRVRLTSSDLVEIRDIVLVGEKKRAFENKSFAVSSSSTVPSQYVRKLCGNIKPSEEFRDLVYKGRKTGSISMLSLRKLNVLYGDGFLKKFRFEVVESVQHLSSKVPMYDIQVFDEDKKVITNGIVTHNSDVVLSLHQTEEMRNDAEMEIRVLKQREGQRLRLRMNWDFREMNFSSLYGETEGEEFEKDEKEKLNAKVKSIKKSFSKKRKATVKKPVKRKEKVKA